MQWDGEKLKMREVMECSMALKCPSIDVHLAGFKKYQQAFSDEKLLKSVVKSQKVVDSVKTLFKGIWSLEDLHAPGAQVNQIVDMAIKNPHGYVVKTQREGGGYNFYDQELKAKLSRAKKSLSADDPLRTYLIMERINPPIIPSVVMRDGQTKIVDSVSEFGMFSCVFINSG